MVRQKFRIHLSDYSNQEMYYNVAASGPTIWTSTYVLESTHCNRLLSEPSCWAQTVHMFTLRLTGVLNVRSDCDAWSLLLLAATVWSYRNNTCIQIIHHSCLMLWWITSTRPVLYGRMMLPQSTNGSFMILSLPQEALHTSAFPSCANVVN